MPDGTSPLLGLSQRLPPANLQAEQALLGALLINNVAYDRVGSFLRPEHFADPVHGRIYLAIQRRIMSGRLADAITLKAEFEHSAALHEVGGVAYLGQLLTSMVGGLLNAREYGRAIHDAWMRRELIEIGEEVVNGAFGEDPEQTADGIAASTVERLLRMSESGNSETSVTYEQALAGAISRSESAYRGDKGKGRLDTGVRTFDALWGGMWPGHLYYLAAPSSTGKTPCALQIARNVAQRLLDEHIATGQPLEHVHLVSLEMAAEDIAVVQLAQATRWTADQIRSGQIGTPNDWMDLERARTELADLPIIVDSPAEMTLGQLGTRARVVRRTRRTRLVIVDYASLIRPDKEQARMPQSEWRPYLGGRLKSLAKALGVPVIVLQQVNKPKDSEKIVRPTRDDLPYDRGQDADGVFGLFRPEISMGTEPPDTNEVSEEKRQASKERWYARRNAVKGVAEFGVLRRRFGPVVWKKMKFDGPRMLFVDPPDEDAPPPYPGEDDG